MKRFMQCMCILLCVIVSAASASGLQGELNPQAETVGYSRDLIEPDETAGQATDIWVLSGKPVEELIDVEPCYQITTPEGLKLFSELVNSGKSQLMGLNVYLGADIDMSNIDDFVPIGNGTGSLVEQGIPKVQYNGTFDGRGYEIDGLVLRAEHADAGQMCYLSLFGVLGKDAEVKNLVLGESCRYECVGDTTNVCSASVVGRMIEGATLQNVLSLATVAGGDICGGLVARLDNTFRGGSVESAMVANCTFMGKVSGKETAGGLIGLCRGNVLVSNCRNLGNAEGAIVGGLVGEAMAAINYEQTYMEWSAFAVRLEISGSENHGNLVSSGVAGGLVGNIENTEEDGVVGVETTLSDNRHTGGICAAKTDGSRYPLIGDAVSERMSVTNCIDSSSTVRLHGSQMREEADGTYAIRFVGSIGHTEYREIGYTIRIKWNGREVEQEKQCGTVYRSMQLENEECTAEALRGEEEAYLCILTIADIPSDAGRVEFTVTPYGIRADGSRESGESYRMIYDGGRYVPGWEVDAG